jgi:RNase P protein component
MNPAAPRRLLVNRIEFDRVFDKGELGQSRCFFVVYGLESGRF